MAVETVVLKVKGRLVVYLEAGIGNPPPRINRMETTGSTLILEVEAEGKRMPAQAEALAQQAGS